MHIYQLTGDGPQPRLVDDLPQLLADSKALTWVDIDHCDAEAVAVLSRVFGFHPLAVHDCVERNHVSKVHVYNDHVFTVLHAPQIGTRGHVHYVELDQFVGENYLVTVHGPLNPAVAPEVAHLDTEAVLRRLQRGTVTPESPFELSAAIVASLLRRETDMVAGLAEKSGELERKLTLDEIDDDPEAFLEGLFTAWYELLAIRTIARHSAATYDLLAKSATALPETRRVQLEAIADRFEQVASMADGQKEFLHGVIEYFQTRISTHMTIAAEEMAATGVRQNDDMRKISAWVAIVAVPTGVTGFFGQNVPYPGYGHTAGLVASLVVMVLLAGLLFLVFKSKRWL